MKDKIESLRRSIGIRNRVGSLASSLKSFISGIKLKAALSDIKNIRGWKKKILMFSMGMIVILIPVLYFSFRNTKEVEAWYNDNWRYRKKATISNSGSEQSNFQVEIDLGDTTGKMNDDCSDVRVVDQKGDEIEDPFWARACNTSSTTLWVKFSTIPTENFDVLIYYGNPSMTTTRMSAGADVFEYFDDFDTDTSSSYTIQEHFDRGSGSGFTWDTTNSQLKSDTSNDDLTIRTPTSLSNLLVTSNEVYNGDNDGVGIFIKDATTFYEADITSEHGCEGIATRGSGECTTQDASSTDWDTLGETHKLSIGYDGTDFTMYVDGSLEATYNISVTPTDFGLVSDGNDPSATYSDLIVTKFTSNPPTTALGSEEIGPGPVASWSFDEGYETGGAQALTKNEQQINVTNQWYTTTTTNAYEPTDNSLGLVNWDADKYPGATVYFEADVYRNEAAYIGLYEEDGSQVATKQCTTVGWSRCRSNAVSLTDDTNYTIRVNDSFGPNPVTMKASRLIIVQSDSEGITDTETQIEIGDYHSTTTDSYSQLDYKKIYYYDSSNFNPIPTAYFEASLMGSGNPTIEQQINISNKAYTTTSSDVWEPTDKSLGLIHWDADKYPGATVYFEADLFTNENADIALYKENGTQVANKDCGANAGWVRCRSNSVSLDDDTNYTIRIRDDWDSGNPVYFRGARLIVIQSDATKITDTETQVEVGSYHASFTNESYSIPNYPKYYVYDQDQFSPTAEGSGDVSFSATIKIDSTEDTVYAELYNNTNGTTVAEVSHTGDTSWTIVTTADIDSDSDWDTTNDDEYTVRIKCVDGGVDGCSGSISGAKILINQSATAGITDLEVLHQQINRSATDGDTSYSDQQHDNRYNPGLSPSQTSFAAAGLTYYFEAVMKTSAGTAYARLHNDTSGSAISGSEITTSNTGDYTRVRSGDITSGMPSPSTYSSPFNMDTQLKNSSTNTTYASSSWLIIQVSDLSTSGPVNAYAELYNLTDGVAVSGSEVSDSSGSWELQRSTPITLTSGKEYVARFKAGADPTLVKIHNAKIILDQTGDTNGVSTVETVQQMINYETSDSDTTYTDRETINRYDPANNSSASATAIENIKSNIDFEVTMKTNNASNAAYARLKNDTDGTTVSGSELTTDGTGYTRVRTSTPINSGMPSSAKNMDTQLKNASTSTTTATNSWLVITNDNTDLSLFHDSTSNKNHGYYGFATIATNCSSNFCLEFDGVESYGLVYDDDVLDFAASDDFTITGWFKHTKMVSGTDTIIAKYEDSGADGGYKVYMESDGDITFAVDDDNTWDPDDSVTSTDASYDDNVWHHFAAIKTGTTKLDLYIDGNLVATDDTISASGTLENNDDLYVGMDGDGSSNPFDGWLDEIEIYPYARSIDEVKVDHVGSSSAFEEKYGFINNGLEGHWDFDESSGNAEDSSGNDYTLTNNNTTAYVDAMFGNGADFTAASNHYFDYSSTIDTIKTVAFWVKPDNTTNYYMQLSSSAYITSSSGTLSATGFTDPKIYVNGRQTTSLSGTNWQHVVVTTETAVEASQFYVGRQGSNYLDGTLDDFRIYNRTLPGHEIDALFIWSPGSVGYWNFDEGAGTSSVYDRSGNNNTGSMSGFGESDWVSGKYGNALDFDGSEDSVSVTDDSTLDFGTDSFTIEAFIKHDGTASSTEKIISKVDGTNGGYKLYMDDSGDICFVTDDDSSWDTDDSACTSGVDYDDGAWHHVVGVKTGVTKIELYVDGNSVASDESLADTNTLSNSGDLHVGVDFDGTTDYFDGVIDEVKIYNYARDPQEIITDMNAEHPVPGSPIGSSKLHLEFDEMYGDTVYDKSGEDNNGDLAGSGITCPGSDPACPDWTLDGKYNSAISFDNTGAYIQMSDTTFNPGTNDFTISAWVTSSANDISARIFSGGYYNYELWSPGGTNNIRAHVGNQSDSIIHSTSTGVNIEDGNWHHIAASFDRDGYLVLYVDGEVADSDDISSYSSYDYDPGTVRVGNFWGATQYGWLGEIDDVRIYHSALTYDQVKVLYNKSSAAALGSSGTDASGNASFSTDRSYCPPGDVTASCGPISIWNFDEYAGGSAYDTSGGGYTGTLAAGDSTPSWTMGKIGPGLKFDGDNDYVRIGTGPTSVKTVEFWAYPETTTEYFIQLSSGADYIYLNSGTITASGVTSPTIYVDGVESSTMVADKWQHVVVTTDTAENANDLDIGRVTDSSFLEGMMDNVRFYDYALSPAQVAWNYNRGAAIAHFELDECEGTTAYDISGKENHGTINIGTSGSNTSAGTCSSGTGTEAWNNGTTGKLNYSLDFDGSDDYVDLNDVNILDFSDDAQTFTISAWINRDTFDTHDVVVAKKNDYSTATEDGYLLAIDSNDQVQFQVGDGSNSCTASGPYTITSSDWYHLTAMLDSSNNCTVYINGKAGSSTSISTSAGPDNALDFRIGSESDGGNAFDGQIDDVKVFNYALTTQQVITNMNQASSVRFAPVTGAPE